MIPHNKPTIDDEDIDSVCAVLRSRWIAPGKKVEEFEFNLANYLSPGGYSIAVESATAAIHLALIALKIKKGNEVILPTYLSIANLNMIKNVGAKPVLVDINPDDYNISFEETQKHITKRTKAIIVPHMYGFPSDIEKFLELGIPIIENCALGIGAKYKNRKVGTFGEISVFSFNATKLLTTAKGGAVYSKNADMMEDIRDLTDILKKPEKPEYRLKFNYRMSDLQAALGITQLKKLDDFHRKRKLIAEQYNEIIARKSYANIIKTADYKDCAWYRYIIISEKNPEEITEKFREKGITTINPLENWELLHKRLGLSGKRFQNAEAITGKTVSIPIYPSLNNDEISKIKNAIDKIY